MIYFARDYSPPDDYFHATCPVCEAAQVRIGFLMEHYAEESGMAGFRDAHSPEITEQDCRCLLGQDFAQDALDYHLNRPRSIKWGAQLRLF